MEKKWAGHSSERVRLCSGTQYRFEKTWGWINDVWIFIFRVNYVFKAVCKCSLFIWFQIFSVVHYDYPKWPQLCNPAEHLKSLRCYTSDCCVTNETPQVSCEEITYVKTFLSGRFLQDYILFSWFCFRSKPLCGTYLWKHVCEWKQFHCNWSRIRYCSLSTPGAKVNNIK